MNPLLSVIMPCYNGERFIAAALESVRTQYRDGIELLVIDDGSEDRTLEIVRDFAPALSMRVISPGRIGNWVAATNIGLRDATGDWACFLHQDDLWLPGRIERLWGEMETAEGALILHNAVFVGPEGKRLGPWTCPFSDGVLRPDQLTERLLVQNFIAINSPVFRRKAALESGALDESLWFSADWDLWLRLGAIGPVRFIDEALSAFRIHPDSQTASRRLLANEWELQLTTVLDRGLKNWTCAGRRRTSVERAARASIAVNSALSAASRGQSPQTLTVLAKLLALGPGGWRRYLRDSRIVQRVSSRLMLKRHGGSQCRS
jgi:glycosyltransferase involved in cell wall biosynthesis